MNNLEKSILRLAMVSLEPYNDSGTPPPALIDAIRTLQKESPDTISMHLKKLLTMFEDDMSKWPNWAQEQSRSLKEWNEMNPNATSDEMFNFISSR